jgi:tetratricopeptide (TPR) repeat protein
MARSILEKIRTINDDEGRLSFEPESFGDFLSLTPQQVASLDRDSLFRSSFLVLTTARDLDPFNTDHTANLGRMFRIWAEMSGDTQDRQDRWEQAIGYYEEATTLSPNNAQLFNEWGLVYFIAGEYEEAIVKYEHSLALDVEFVQTYVLLGDAYAMAGDAEGAIEAYGGALELQPRQLTPRLQLCALLGQQGELEQAAEQCQKALQLSPNDYQAHRNLAIIYRDLGRIEDAIVEATKARELATEEEKPNWDSFISQLEAMIQ